MEMNHNSDKAPRRWWIFENPSDRDLVRVYFSNPSWIAERDTLYEVIEASAYDAIVKQRDELKSENASLRVVYSAPCPECGYVGCSRGRMACDAEIDKLKAELQRERTKVEMMKRELSGAFAVIDLESHTLAMGLLEQKIEAIDKGA